MRIINSIHMSFLSSSLWLLSGQSFAAESQHEMSMSAPYIPTSEDHSIHHVQPQKVSSAPQAVAEVQQMQALPQTSVSSDSAKHTFDHSAHVKEHGGQIYQHTTLESQWLRNDDGDGVLKSALETRVGTDENKMFIKLHVDQAESQHAEYDAKLLYSRNVADFWDVQAGLRYRHDQNLEIDQEQVDAVFGIHGLAPYFFETDAYLYIGQDRQVSVQLDSERDLLLTQKLILKPYLEMNVVFSDDSAYAQKSGLSSAQVGLETRYEINKKVMPFMDVAYGYHHGREETAWQSASSSENEWLYGAGIRFKF